MGELFVLSPLIATSLAFMWLWLRAEGRAHRAERERDDLWDASTSEGER